MKKTKTIVISFFIWLSLFSPSQAYDVAFIGNQKYDAELIQEVALVNQLYGLTTKYVFLQERQGTSQLHNIVKNIEPQTVVISAKTIISLGLEKQLSGLINNKITNKKILVTNISPVCNSGALKRWSQGKILACQLRDAPHDSVFYQIRDVFNITRELSGQTLPYKDNNLLYLITTHKDIQSIIDVKVHEALYLPVFVKTTLGTNEIFFSTNTGVSNTNKEFMTIIDSERLIKIAPLLMFLRYSLGERCWHSSHDYANFTIDDPWLIEPYGNLSFHALNREMEKNNFHTTIAFIPWNYERSRKEVVKVFLDNPSRFSICIHGNNHDHREFYKYENKPLGEQEFNIRQALARMENFSKLTAIPYEKIMIFPHDISPANTLELLKKYNFMATINSSNVPLDSQKPEDPIFNIRPISMHYNAFASVKRRGPYRKPIDIAFDLFLDNPLFFFAHQNLFAPGIDAFNQTAKITNSIQPQIVWQSVGYIMQHYYLEKLRSDGNYDIEVYSNDFIIENNHVRNLTYYIKKKESRTIPIQEVTADDKIQLYTLSGDSIQIVIPLKKNEVKHVKIKYRNKLDIASVETGRTDVRDYLLRTLSDFRDLIVSRTQLGNKITTLYYESNLYKLGLILIVPSLITITFIIFFTFRIFLKRKKKL